MERAVAAGEVGVLRFAKDGILVAADAVAARLFGFATADELVAAAGEGRLVQVALPGEGDALLNSILHDLPNPVFVKDERHCWVILNDSYCRLMGYQRDELLGRSDHDFFPAAEADVFWAKDDAIFAAAGTNENEELFTDAAGRTHVILTRKTLHTEPSGRRLLLGVITDISERKRMEEELKQSRDQLDARVAERTAALCEANRRLQEADRCKNEFLALLGHELRNPLNPIRVSVSLLRRAGAADPSLRRAQEIIDRQVTQMARLIDDLLDVSRISRGKILLREECVDIVELVRTVVGDRREGLLGRSITLDAGLPASPIFVRADPARIAQAIGNLLDNAEKFTDPGGRIAVEIERQPGGRSVSVAVRDTGIGMSKETLAQIFEPFAQAERSVARGRGGLGLGLSVVRGLVDLHRGSVTAESEGEGRGSTLTIRLPLPDQRPHTSSGAAPPPAPANARRILVIEDNRDAAEALDMALSAAGHEVAIACSGEEGIARARAFLPRVVLSDIGLPGMSGYEVARTLRSDRAFSSTHLIAVTGYGQQEDQRLAIEAGFDRHLTKPFDMEALEGILAALPPGP